MNENETFAQKLKAAKKAAGMSQQKMADKMLIPKRTIEDWERGIFEPPAYLQRFVLNELAERAEKLAKQRELEKRHIKADTDKTE